MSPAAAECPPPPPHPTPHTHTYTTTTPRTPFRVLSSIRPWVFACTYLRAPLASIPMLPTDQSPPRPALPLPHACLPPFWCRPSDPDTPSLAAPTCLPACSPKGEHIPHGMIFSCFMVSSMVGSAIAGRLLGGGGK